MHSSIYLLFTKTNKVKSLIIVGLPLAVLIFGFWEKFRDNFRWIYLLQPPNLEWYTRDRAPFDFLYNFLLGNQYFYLPIVFVLAIITLILLRKKKSLVYLYTSCVILFVLISLQGYQGEYRYLYMAFPFFAIVLAKSLKTLISAFKNYRPTKIIVIIVILVIAIQSMCVATVESRSPLSQTSKLDQKNINVNQAIDVVRKKSGNDLDNSIIVTDYYLPMTIHFNLKTPDYMLLDFDLRDKGNYLAIPEIDCENDLNGVLKSERDVYILLRYRNGYPAETCRDYIKSNFELIYSQDNIVIYLKDRI